MMTEIPSERLPKPTGWRILIEPAQVRERSRGGIVLPDQSKAAQEALRYIGRVVAKGPQCYQGDRFHDGTSGLHAHWCKVGDWIAHGQYGGQEIIISDDSGQPRKLRLINDDEVIALVNPESVMVHGV
jgi:co-chaperonin GroES (HSP10)